MAEKLLPVTIFVLSDMHVALVLARDLCLPHHFWNFKCKYKLVHALNIILYQTKFLEIAIYFITLSLVIGETFFFNIKK